MLRMLRWLDRVRSSLFALPALAVVVAYLVARWLAGVEVGAWVGEATIDSARAVLSMVAAATVAFASIAFSVSLLIMQQGANQHSPRVLHGLVRDPFNRRVIAVVMATFTFCLVTMQRVRDPLDGSEERSVPQLSVALAVLFGLVAILSVIAAIHHTARTIDVSVVLARVVDQASTTMAIAPPDGARSGDAADRDRWPDDHTRLAMRSDGWVTSLDAGALLDALPPGATMRVETAPGRYAMRHMVVARVVPPLGDDRVDEVERRVNHAIGVGPARTSLQDPGFAIRQVVDVGLRALSPGVNDPTTALDAIFHLGTLLIQHLRRPPQPTCFDDDEGRRVEMPHLPSDDDIAVDAISELRSVAGGNPAVYTYLLEMIAAVIEAVGASERTRPLREQATLVMAAAEHADLLAADLDRLRRRYADRFADGIGPAGPVSG